MKSPQSLAVGSGTMKSCICLVVALMALSITQSHASAALVINSVVTSVDNSNPLTSTVNVSLYGLFRLESSPEENISAFGVRVKINVNAATPLLSISNATNASGSQWSLFSNVPTPATDLSSGTVTFRAYNSPNPSIYTPISATTPGVLTLIGTFSFTASKSTTSQSFTTEVQAAAADGPQGSAPFPPVATIGVVGSGFLNNGQFGWTNITTNFNADPANVNNPNPVLGTGTITPTAVPEPSSLALLGLVSAGGYIARRRRAAKVS